MRKINLDDDSLSLSGYIGGVLRIIRCERGLSGDQLAKNINISQQQVSRYERGVTGFQIDMLFRFLSELGMNESEMHCFFYQVVDKARKTPQYQFRKYE